MGSRNKASASETAWRTKSHRSEANLSSKTILVLLLMLLFYAV